MPFCKIDTTKLYFQEQGIKNQIPIIFLHGWMRDSNDWKYLVRQLKREQRTIVLDFRGHGRSEKIPGYYSRAQFSNDLFLLIKNLKIEKAIIVGHSMGGTVGLKFTLDHQDMVENLILINAPVKSVFSFIKRVIIRVLEIILTIMPYKLFVKIYAFYKKKDPPNQKLKALEIIQKIPKPVLKSCIHIKRENFNFSPKLSKILIPTLIIYSNKDRKELQNQAVYLGEHISNSELKIIHNAGHSPMIETPKKLIKIIKNFVNK